MNASLTKKSFLGAVIGTFLEYYDFGLWPIFLPLIAPIFFGGENAYSALVKSYTLSLIIIVARPAGGLIFGHYGDCFGRSRVLIGSLYGIAISTLILGFIPSYRTIGITATIIAIAARWVQSFSYGGEYNGAGVYVVEQATHRPGLMGSLLTASSLLGLLVASLIGVICTLPFMPIWSWRIAFMFGGVIGIFGLVYRKNLGESSAFQQADAKEHNLIVMFKRYPRQLLAGIFIGGFSSIAFTTALLFINPVLMTKGLISRQELMGIQVFLTLLASITLITAGLWADKISTVKVMKYGCLALIFSSYPLLHCVDHGNLISIIIGEGLLVIINGMILGTSNAYLKNLFIMQYRYRATSLSFCAGVSLFSGLTPIVENYFYQTTGNFGASALWLIFIGISTGLVIIFESNSTTDTRVYGRMSISRVDMNFYRRKRL